MAHVGGGTFFLTSAAADRVSFVQLHVIDNLGTQVWHDSQFEKEGLLVHNDLCVVCVRCEVSVQLAVSCARRCRQHARVPLPEYARSVLGIGVSQ